MGLEWTGCRNLGGQGCPSGARGAEAPRVGAPARGPPHLRGPPGSGVLEYADIDGPEGAQSDVRRDIGNSGYHCAGRGTEVHLEERRARDEAGAVRGEHLEKDNVGLGEGGAPIVLVERLEHGDDLRRAPALAAALKADRPESVELGEELNAEEHYWSPGTVQFARRVRACVEINQCVGLSDCRVDGVEIMIQPWAEMRRDK